jgi:hypothetical protein
MDEKRRAVKVEQDMQDKACDQALFDMAVSIRKHYDAQDSLNEAETQLAVPALIESFKDAADNLIRNIRQWQQVVERRLSRSHAGMSLNASYVTVAHTGVECLHSLASAIDHSVDPDLHRVLKQKGMGSSLQRKHESVKEVAEESMKRAPSQ